LQIFFIKKKTIINILIIAIAVWVSITYTSGPGKGTIGVFLNNENVMPICSVDVPDKRIALTFDSAWGDEYTQDILEVLKRYNIKATFFLTGAWVDKYPDAVKQIYDDGHEIGNHSTTHVKMTKISKDSIISELKVTESKIYSITRKRTTLFRAPFGEYNNRMINTARGVGYNIIQWDIDSLDWKGLNEQDICSRVITKVGKGSIILFHNNMENTYKALPGVIEKLRKDGYKFITVSELLLNDDYYIDNTGRQKSLKHQQSAE
jgi:peptidoglycan-N-acetylglucosamine deacetylase